MQWSASTAFAFALSLLATVPGASLAADRDVLPDNAQPIAYDIVIEPNIAAQTFEGEADLDFELKKRASRIVVNGADLTVASAVLDGKTPARIETDNKAQRIAFVFDEPIKKGEHHLDVHYSGLIYDQALGLFIVKYPTPKGEKSMLATQFEPGDARRFAPLWDEPARKAVFSISAILPKGMDAVSNMPAAKTTALANGKVRTEFAPTPKMSSYLMFFGAGDLDRITRKQDGVEFGVVTQAGDSQKGRYALDATAKILAYYNDYFGTPYPLPKLDEIAVPGGGGFGAMENWGAIMYFEQTLLLDPKVSTPADKQEVFLVLAHEIAHQWFGDLVTMAWWDDIWLNEGFASWMESKATDILNPDWGMWLQSFDGRERALSLDSVPSSHPIVQNVRNIDEANLAFDDITYRKGRAVIRMIEAYVGEDAFRKGVRRYIKKHKYGNARTDDLWREVEAASKAPVSKIAHDFTSQPGVPLIIVDDAACDEATGETTITLHQGRFSTVAGAKPGAETWRTPVTAEIVGTGQAARETISGPRAQSMTAQGCGTVKVNVAETGYFRTLYADALFDGLAKSFAQLSAEDQLGLLNDAYALGESGDAPFSRFLNLVEQTPAGANPIIIGEIADNLGSLRAMFKGDADAGLFADFSRRWLRRAFESVGWDAKPGESENQAILRANLIESLAAFGDKDVIAEARRRFAAYQKDPSALSPDILRTVVDVVARKADTRTFDRLLASLRGAATPSVQRLYLNALANVEDETLAKRVIDAYLDKKTPVQLAARMLRRLADHHPDLVWNYYREHYQAIDPLLDPLQRLKFASNLADDSSNAAVADQLETFAAEHLPASTKAAIARTAEQIRFSAAVKQQRLPDLGAWLEAHG